jgi:hypothetical protein
MDPRGRLRVSRGAKERQRDCTGRRPAATQIVKVGIRVLRRATRTHSMPPAMTRTKSKNEVRFLSQPTPNPAVEPLESFVQTLYGCLNSGGQNPYRLRILHLTTGTVCFGCHSWLHHLCCSTPFHVRSQERAYTPRTVSRRLAFVLCVQLQLAVLPSQAFLLLRLTGRFKVIEVIATVKGRSHPDLFRGCSPGRLSPRVVLSSESALGAAPLCKWSSAGLDGGPAKTEDLPLDWGLMSARASNAESQ